MPRALNELFTLLLMRLDRRPMFGCHKNNKRKSSWFESFKDIPYFFVMLTIVTVNLKKSTPLLHNATKHMKLSH